MSIKLAAYGGEKVREKPLITQEHYQGRFGEEEKNALAEVIDSGYLCRMFGDKVNNFEKEAAEYFGAEGAVAVSSGTAAIHCALAAIEIGPGDEVITAPITDMGSVIPIVAQNAIPVFADVDPDTYNITAENIEKVITPRTKAILVVHLAGQSCVMEPILELAKKHNLYVIEDCAQSYLSTCNGKLVGTMGDIGCFSLNDFKHISCGDGGFVISNNKDLLIHAKLFADKGYPRTGSVRNSVIFGLNYRMTELHAAVARVQLKKLSSVIDRMRKFSKTLTGLLDLNDYVKTPKIAEGVVHSAWFFPLVISTEKLGTDPKTFTKELNAEGIPVYYPYLAMPVYLFDCIKNKNIYGKTSCPFDCHLYENEVSYEKGLCPIAEDTLTNMMILPCNEFMTNEDAEDIANTFKKVCDYHLGK